MHVPPNSDPFLDFSEDISSNSYSTNIKNFDISPRKFVQLGSDCKYEKSIFVDQLVEINKFVIFNEITNGKLTVALLNDSSAEEVEQALVEEKLGILEASEDGSTIIKFSTLRTAELESAGVNSVEVRESSGTVRTYTSFKFQALSDRELNLLITQTKTYIVFLKTKGDQSDEKIGKKIIHLERRSLYLKLERAIRTSQPELKYLLEGLLKTSPYKIAIRMVEIWNYKKAVEENREQEEIKKALEIKHIIVLEEIDKLELHKIIIKDLVVKNDFKSEGLTKKNVKEENSRRITHINHYISIYNGLDG